MSHWSRIPAPQVSQQAFRPKQLALILLALAIITALHLPGAWVNGRFMDEEATVFLAYAWHFPPFEALFRPFAGYLNIAANASTLVLVQMVRADLISLERAPYFTMLLGLAFQLAPSLLILTGQAPWLRSRNVRLASSLLIAIAPGTEEVALNVIHIQFHLALCVAILLALDPPSSRLGRFLSSMSLLVAPLCGPAAILLLPLFVLRAWHDADRLRVQQALFLGLGSAAQLLLFYGDSPVRGTRPDAMTAIAGALLRLVVMPLFGSGFSERMGEQLAYSQPNGMAVTAVVALMAVAILGGYFLFALRRQSSTTWLIGAALVVALATFCFGMASPSPIFVLLPSAGPRYNYLPVVLLGIANFAMAAEAKGRWRTFFLAVSAMWLTVSAIGYVRPTKVYAEGPSWAEEVANWRTNSDYPMRAWASRRAVELPVEARPCVPSSLPKGDPDAPYYCEAGWMVGFWPAAMRGPDEQVTKRWTYPLAPGEKEE